MSGGTHPSSRLVRWYLQRLTRRPRGPVILPLLFFLALAQEPPQSVDTSTPDGPVADDGLGEARIRYRDLEGALLRRRLLGWGVLGCGGCIGCSGLAVATDPGAGLGAVAGGLGLGVVGLGVMAGGVPVLMTSRGIQSEMEALELTYGSDVRRPAHHPTVPSIPTSGPTWIEPVSPCCKVCSTGQACGNSCISWDSECHQPPGCAC